MDTGGSRQMFSMTSLEFEEGTLRGFPFAAPPISGDRYIHTRCVFSGFAPVALPTRGGRYVRFRALSGLHLCFGDSEMGERPMGENLHLNREAHVLTHVVLSCFACSDLLCVDRGSVP